MFAFVKSFSAGLTVKTDLDAWAEVLDYDKPHSPTKQESETSNETKMIPSKEEVGREIHKYHADFVGKSSQPGVGCPGIYTTST